MRDSVQVCSVRAFVSWAPMNGHVSARCPACPHLLHDAFPEMLFPSRVSCPRLAIGLSHVVDFCPADESLALAAVAAVFVDDLDVALVSCDLSVV